MLEIAAYVVAALAVFAAGVLVVASRRPDHFSVARSASIAAAPSRIFPLIDELKPFNTWNPYDRRDPDIKGTYAGPASGKGARYEFESRKSGTGSIEITETVADRLVAMRLVMVKPFRCDNRVEFTLVPNGSGTTVTWAMSGRQPLLAKAMTLFLDCDRMVGRDFDEGLTSLKALVERA